jgi:hypothetical protein
MKVRTIYTRSVADALHRASCLVVVGVLLVSLPQALAQQYPPPAYPSPGYGGAYPGPAQPPAYPGPGYGGPTGAPPPLQQEAIPPPPGAAMVWTPGYWSWAGRWVWVPGSYAARPYAHAVWVPGQWRPRHGTWVWVPGHWRR